MRRSLVVLVAVGTMLLPQAATAKKPPEPPADLVCVFDAQGVLHGWDGTDGTEPELWDGSSRIRCKLTADPMDSFTFVLESTGADTVLHPSLAITDVYPAYGDICFRDWVNGRQKADENGVFWTTSVSPLDSYGEPDGNCGDNPDYEPEHEFALTVSVVNMWGGTVQLRVEADESEH